MRSRSPRELTQMLAAVRVAAGLSFAVAPRLAGSLLVGGDAGTAGARLFIRAFGARDILLGVGTWRAAHSDGDTARPWLGACILADTFDAVAVLRHFHALPARRRTFALVLSLVPALAGADIARISNGRASSSPRAR
jgi:hypothetical protein